MLISALNVIQHGALVGVTRASLHGAVCAMVAVACAPLPVLGGGRFGRVPVAEHVVAAELFAKAFLCTNAGPMDWTEGGWAV